MSIWFVLAAIGKLSLFLSVILLGPLAIALGECYPLAASGGLLQPKLIGFWAAIVSSLLFGLTALYMGRKRPSRSLVREGFAIVTFGWMILAFFSCLPLFFWLLAEMPNCSAAHLAHCFTDAYFESMSGFSTTGATILNDIEALPAGLLFWRSLTHWLGGMGIVTLALAVFPAFGVAGYQMFRSELPGPTKDRLKPRLAQTAKILWSVYLLLTVVEVLLLVYGGMSWIDASCHAFATMGTGGFSSRNGSVGAYNSSFIEWVIVIFMFIAGTNFLIHYQILSGVRLRELWKDTEYRFYIIVIGGAVLLATVVLRLASAQTLSLADGLRQAAFQVVSVTTTTGFCTTDYNVWPLPLRLMLVGLMFCGGCAGSTAGGIKMVRIVVVLKAAWRQVRLMVTPRLVAPVKCNGMVVNEKLVQMIIGFIVLFMLLFFFFTFVMTWFMPDLETAATSVVATLSNVGPGLAKVGPSATYAWVPLPGKWVLAFCMLLGRLEVFTVIIAFAPLSWRK